MAYQPPNHLLEVLQKLSTRRRWPIGNNRFVDSQETLGHLRFASGRQAGLTVAWVSSIQRTLASPTQNLQG